MLHKFICFMIYMFLLLYVIFLWQYQEGLEPVSRADVAEIVVQCLLDPKACNLVCTCMLALISCSYYFLEKA